VALPLVSLPKQGISLKAIQKAAIVAALEAEDWSQARAAQRLLMLGGALNRHITRHQIAYPPEHAHKRRPRRQRALVRR
jgi:transcriptional regulator with GAF, ATPase, and Fis domain